MGLGAAYGVNPLVFGAIYVGAIPFFTLSLGWLVRNLKRKRPIALPLLLTMLFFVSSYLYLLIAGRNIPVWVYGFVAAMIGIGVFTTVQNVRQQLAAERD